MTSDVMTAPAEDDSPPVHDPQHDRRWLILAVLGLVQLMVVLDSHHREYRPADGPTRAQLL